MTGPGERSRREAFGPTLVVLLAAVAACAAGAVGIALLGGGHGWSASAAARGLDRDAIAGARNAAVARRALERAGASGADAGELLDNSAVGSGGQGVLVVTVEADRAPAARRLATAYAAVLADGAPGARVSAAGPADKKSGGLAGTALIGAGVGLVAGFALALLRERLDVRRSSSRRLERRLGLERLGAVPGAPAGPIAFGLPVLEEPGGAEAVAYEELSVAVQREAGASALLVAGTVEGDEGPRVAAGLALALARRGRTVALLELDPAAPALRRLFALERGAGMADVLRGEIELGGALAPVPGTPELAVLTAGDAAGPGGGDPAGPDVPAPRAAAVVADLRRRFDVVIAAGPPLLSAAPPPRGLDGLLVAIHLGRVRHSRRPLVERALGEVGMPVLGFVLVGGAAVEG